MKKQDENTDTNNENNEVSGRPPYNVHIKTAADVRRLLSTIINGLRQNKMDVPRARAIIYASQVLLNVFEQSSLEDRISELERMANK